VTSGKLANLIWDDLEETLVSPVLIPGVHDQKVVDSVLYAITYDLDGVTTESLACFVLVDTTLVAQEVLIDGESACDWTIGDEILLEMINVRDGVSS